MPAPILTIVIPTFDRPQRLANLLKTLLPQKDDRWKLLIVDNCSPRPVRDFVPVEAEVVRNSVNIGAAGSFPRCFELMDTNWVWMIGDDDLVDSNGLEVVLNAIAQYPEAAILNFGSHGQRTVRSDARVFHGFDEFITKSDSLIETVWMSGNVYSRRHYWPYISLAYRFANTQSAHYVLLMMVLIGGGTYVQLPNPVCCQADEMAPSANHSELVSAIVALADLPMSNAQRRKFLSRMQRGYTELVRDVIQCAYHLDNGAEREEILYLFRMRWGQSAIARNSWMLAVVSTLGRLVLSLGIGRLVVRALIVLKTRITRQQTHYRPHVPRFHRII